MRRYFLFTYGYDNILCSGNGNVFFDYLGFPPMWFVKDAAVRCGCSEDSNITILGWNEFNDKEDYESFLEAKST